MNVKIVPTILAASIAFSGAAYAQSTTPATPAASPPAAAASSTSSTQTMNLKGGWRASKLMGLDVYNEANEKLGDVNELILDMSGKVTAVVIGVGGFLGMGEHDVAVSMDKLRFSETPRNASTNTSASGATPTANSAATTGSGTAAPKSTASMSEDWVPDHAVLNATKDQLKSMKQFKYDDNR